jgi:hypothetical protein
MTASLPVIAYAEYYDKSHEELLRALTLSNLVTLHLKRGIGRLSAYCGDIRCHCKQPLLREASAPILADLVHRVASQQHL